MEVVKRVEHSAWFEVEYEAKLYEHGRADVTDRGWGMVMGLDGDPELRARLF